MLPWVALSLRAQTIDTSAGDQLYAQGRFEEAAVHYRQGLARAPGEAALLGRMAACEYQLDRFAEAAKYYREALQSNPDLSPAQRGLGRSLIKLGRAAEAIPYLETVVKLAPDDRMAQRALAVAYHMEKRPFKAERLFKSLVESNTQDPKSWYYLGAFFFESERFTLALEALETSLKLQPDHDLARVHAAASLAELGRAKEAESAFLELLAEPTLAGNADVLLGYARLLFQTGREEAALVRMGKALPVRPDSAELRFWQARILFNMGRLRQAAEEAEHALRLASEARVRSLLLKIYKAQGRTEEAAEQAAWLRNQQSEKTRRPKQ